MCLQHLTNHVVTYKENVLEDVIAIAKVPSAIQFPTRSQKVQHLPLNHQLEYLTIWRATCCTDILTINLTSALRKFIYCIIVIKKRIYIG